MKRKLFKSFMLLTLAALFLAPVMQSCKSSKKVSNNDEVEVAVYCSGPEFFSDNEYFRANNIGESSTQSMAKKKALSNARLDLAASIETQVKAVIDNYFQSYSSGDAIEDKERYEGLSREVINQELSGIRTKCEKFTKTANGSYKCYVAIELAGEEILNGMKNRISDDDKLRTDFEYEKFKKVFKEEMESQKGQ